MPQRPDLPRPVMGRSTSLHPDATGRRLGEESKHLTSAQLTRNRGRTLALDCMHLEKVLRQVDPNPDKSSSWTASLSATYTGHALALDAVRVRPSTSSLRPLRQRQPRRKYRSAPARCSRRREPPAAARNGSPTATPDASRLRGLPMFALRRPHDRHRGLRPRLRAKAALADPEHERHIMTRQTACQRRRLPVPLRWLHAGGDLSRHNHPNQRADRPLIRSTPPPRSLLRAPQPRLHAYRGRSAPASRPPP